MAEQDNELVKYMFNLLDNKTKNAKKYKGYFDMVLNEIITEFKVKLDMHPQLPDRQDYYNFTTYFAFIYPSYQKTTGGIDDTIRHNLRTHISQILLYNQKTFLHELKKCSISCKFTKADKQNTCAMRRYLLLLFMYTWDIWHNEYHREHKNKIDVLVKRIAPDSTVIYEPNNAYNICTNIKVITPDIRELIKILADIKK